MKKTYALIALLCCAAFAKAENKALRIEFNDGKTALYSLAGNPVVTFEGNVFTIKSTGAETSYPRADVKNFTFVKDESGIKNLTDVTKYSYSGNVFSCAGNEINVYDMSGVRVANGMDSVSLNGLGDGVYIVRAGKQSIKVVKQ